MDAPKSESFPPDLKEQVEERSALLKELAEIPAAPVVKLPERVR